MGLVDTPIPRHASSSYPGNKKQTKEERDRLKQIEKKRRRLEKALATSAAIRLELEKKKQRKKEEEQRLDEEGAALAEAVALHVLLDEDTEALTRLKSYAEFDVQSFGRLSRSDHVDNVGSYVSYVSSNKQCDLKMAYHGSIAYKVFNQGVSYFPETNLNSVNNDDVTFTVGQGNMENGQLWFDNSDWEPKATLFAERTRKADMAAQAFTFLTVSRDASSSINNDRACKHGYMMQHLG